MAIVFFQYLQNCNDENVFNLMEKFPKRFNILPNIKQTHEQMCQRLSNFAKSGHTARL